MILRGSSVSVGSAFLTTSPSTVFSSPCIGICTYWKLTLCLNHLARIDRYQRRVCGMRIERPKASVRKPGVRSSPAANRIIAPSVRRSGEICPLAKFLLIFAKTEFTDRFANTAPMIPEITTIEIEKAKPV